MPSASRNDDLQRIRRCLQSIAHLVACRDQSEDAANHANEENPCTALDREIDRAIFRDLPLPGEGWLSEETEDNPARLTSSRVWIVDPIDGTREFVEGVPEWCVSIALIEEGEAVAGGILNPCTGEMFLGSQETGLEIEGSAAMRAYRSTPGSRCTLVSRKEHREGKWDAAERTGQDIVPVGSIAYRMAHVAAGYADATCTLEPRSEWDIAAGVALILAAGGRVQMLDGSPIRFNHPVPRVENIVALGKNCSTLPHIIQGTGSLAR